MADTEKNSNKRKLYRAQFKKKKHTHTQNSSSLAIIFCLTNCLTNNEWMYVKYLT